MYHGLCTNMEAAALAQTCESKRVPFLYMRAMSERSHHFAGMSFADFLVSATKNYRRIFESVFQIFSTLRETCSLTRQSTGLPVGDRHMTDPYQSFQLSRKY